MQLALSTPSAPSPVPVWDELSENSRQGFTAKNPAWHPAPNTVNSTTAIGMQAGLALEAVRKSERARYYNPQTGRFISEDPMGFSGSGPNLYAYAADSPINFVDPFGLATYVTNRKIGGGPALPPGDLYSHTFTFSADDNGNVTATYSWGNTANWEGWNLNQPEDMAAAAQALQKGYAQRVGNDDMDPFYEQAFNQLNNRANNHWNLVVGRNCKTETTKLGDLAHHLYWSNLIQQWWQNLWQQIFSPENGF